MTRKQKKPSSKSFKKDDDLLYALRPDIWAKEVLGYHPDPWQADLLQSRDAKIILNCSRQSGKSTTCAALALHECVYRLPTFVLAIAPSQYQSGELMRKFDEFRSGLELESAYWNDCDDLEDNKLAVQFANRNRFIARPGSEKTSRGFSAVTLLLEDEAAWVSDELYKAVRPMLAVSHGRHILMSTPKGKRGHFWEIWNKNRPTWKRFEIPANLCPRITPEFLAEELADHGELYVAQEYYCAFVDDEFALFDEARLKKALSDEFEEIDAEAY